MHAQLELFEGEVQVQPDMKLSRSGTFVDNLSLPVHRWFRYSAGFAAQWVEQVLTDWGIEPGQLVLDPFSGSGTVPIVCDTLGISSIGVEAHPVVSRIAQAKLLWGTPSQNVESFANAVLRHS